MAKKYSKRDLESFRKLLLKARAVVSGDLDQLEEEAFGGISRPTASDQRPEDSADSYYQELNLELLQRDQSTLREIDEAIERVEAGVFGLCEDCGEVVHRERLKAVPHARKCIGCQRESEQSGW